MAIIKTTNRSISGTILPANLGSGTASSSTVLYGDSSFKAEPSYDDNKVVNDISTLALHQATNNNSAKYNLTNSNVDVYQDSTAIANLTNCARTAEEYIATIYTTTAAFTNDANTVLLYHFDNNITDSSTNAVSTTGNGSSITYSTSIKKFGTHSMKLGGTNEYLSTPSLASLAVACPTTGDYTLEFWCRQATGSGEDRWFSFGNNGLPSGAGVPAGICASWAGADYTTWNMYNSTANPMASGFPLFVADTWYHYCFQRESGALYMFLNGVWEDTFTSSDHSGFSAVSLLGGDANLFIGNRSGSSSEFVDGYYDEFRMSDNIRHSIAGKSEGDTVFVPNEVSADNATGSYESTAQTANASVSTMSGVVTYTNNKGTATLNTDIILQVSADNGSNWANATLTAAGTFSSGVLQAVTNDITVTAGTQLKYKMSFANQASASKETRINGVSLSY